MVFLYQLFNLDDGMKGYIEGKLLTDYHFWKLGVPKTLYCRDLRSCMTMPTELGMINLSQPVAKTCSQNL